MGYTANFLMECGIWSFYYPLLLVTNKRLALYHGKNIIMDLRITINNPMQLSFCPFQYPVK